MTAMGAPAPWKDGIPGSFLVYKEGSEYIARYGKYGGVLTQGSVAATVIQAAMDALTSGRAYKERVVLKGSFTLASALTIPSWTILDLREARLILADGVNADILTNDSYPSSGGSDDCEIWGGAIDGNRANQTGNGSIVFYGAQRLKMYGTRIKNVYGTGVLGRTCLDCKFQHLYVENPRVDGVTLYDGCLRNLISDTGVTGNDGTFGILVEGAESEGQAVSKRNTVLRCTSELSSSMGISFRAGVTGSRIVLCWAYTAENAGIESYSLTRGSTTYQNKDNIIALNVCWNNNQAEENFDRGNGIVLYDDNTIGTINHLVYGNRCFDDQGTKTQEYGIGEGWSLAGTLTDYNQVLNNIVLGNKDGGVSMDGAHSEARGNLGYNPVAASTPSVGASPVTFGPYPYPAVIEVDGGTVSGITVRAQATGAVAGQWYLYPSDTMVITYSVAPTVTLWPM